MNKKVFLFPLPQSILLKKVTLPLHIFEPRYKLMVKDSLKNEIPMAIVPLHPSGHYEGKVCVAGLPHILNSYSDGRMDIYITGTLKCELKEPISEDPYKSYFFRSLMEDMTIDDSCDLELESFRTLLERWALNFLQDSTQSETFKKSLNDPELLVNYCTVFLTEDFFMKKTIMECESLREKIVILMKVLGPKEIFLGPFLPKLKF